MAISIRNKYERVKIKVRKHFLNAIENTPVKFCLYKSYWHAYFKKTGGEKYQTPAGLQFIAQKPNYTAGIGHQLANWNTGYYFSIYFKTSFAHFPFASQQWEKLLDLGEGEVPAAPLLTDSSFKKVKLPRFDSTNETEIALAGRIIQSYKNRKVFFLLAQDQGYVRQCDTAQQLSDKFFHAAARKNDHLFYNASHFNIAIHIRRGDIVNLKQSGAAQGEKRWLENTYYINVLQQVMATLKTGKQADIYIFSQGDLDEFKEFSAFDNVKFCLDTNQYDTFLHLVYADLLISSKSSFSYKPALLSKGIKICPGHFWHNYPATDDYIIADDDGNFDTSGLKEVTTSTLKTMQ